MLLLLRILETNFLLGVWFEDIVNICSLLTLRNLLSQFFLWFRLQWVWFHVLLQLFFDELLGKKRVLKRLTDYNYKGVIYAFIQIST